MSLSGDTPWQPPAFSLAETQPAIDPFHSFSFPQYLKLSFSWAISVSPYSEWTSGIQLPSVETIPACQMCLRSLRPTHQAAHKRLMMLSMTDSSSISWTKPLPAPVACLPNWSTVTSCPPHTLSWNQTCPSLFFFVVHQPWPLPREVALVLARHW